MTPSPKVEHKMIARRIAVAVVTAALSLGIVAAISAPAQAGDTSWGYLKGIE